MGWNYTSTLQLYHLWIFSEFYYRQFYGTSIGVNFSSKQSQLYSGFYSAYLQCTFYKLLSQKWRCAVKFLFECILLLKYTNITHHWIFIWTGALLVTLTWHCNFLRMHKILPNFALTISGMYYKCYGTHQEIHSGCPEDKCVSTMNCWPLSVWRSSQEQSFSSVYYVRCDVTTLHTIADDNWWRVPTCCLSLQHHVWILEPHFHIWAWSSGVQKIIISVVVMNSTKPSLDQWSFEVICDRW